MSDEQRMISLRLPARLLVLLARLVGRRGRSEFIRRAIEEKIEREDDG